MEAWSTFQRPVSSGFIVVKKIKENLTCANVIAPKKVRLEKGPFLLPGFSLAGPAAAASGGVGINSPADFPLASVESGRGGTAMNLGLGPRAGSWSRCPVPELDGSSSLLHPGLRWRASRGRRCASSTSCGRRVAKSATVAAAVHGKEARDGLLQPRRAALYCVLGVFGLSVGRCDSAVAAFSPGFPGVKDWLKGQKRKTASFLLAPISASRDRLSSALLLISSDDVTSSSFEEAETLVKVAARDCMPLQAGSILEFQSRTGVEVCTFKLVLKNAASLLDNADPAKLKAEESLLGLIRSFISLDEILASGASGGSPDRKALKVALVDTAIALDRFEEGVRACLGIE